MSDNDDVCLIYANEKEAFVGQVVKELQRAGYAQVQETTTQCTMFLRCGFVWGLCHDVERAFGFENADGRRAILSMCPHENRLRVALLGEARSTVRVLWRYFDRQLLCNLGEDRVQTFRSLFGSAPFEQLVNLSIEQFVQRAIE
jgi:hypothetical protein